LAFWAVAISTTVEPDALVVTAIAVLDMTTKCRRSAQFDRTHVRRCAVHSEAPWVSR